MALGIMLVDATYHHFIVYLLIIAQLEVLTQYWSWVLSTDINTVFPNPTDDVGTLSLMAAIP